MPAYSFRERFVPFVIDGSKPHTIRSRRPKGAAKKGDTLYLYYGMRTKHCTKLREETCTKAPTIIIDREDIFILDRRLEDHEIQLVGDELIVDVLAIEMHAAKLTPLERNILAWHDGFRPDGTSLKSPEGCYDLMMRFWKQTHELPFVGHIIYWDPQPLPGKPFLLQSLQTFNSSIKKYLPCE